VGTFLLRILTGASDVLDMFRSLRSFQGEGLSCLLTIVCFTVDKMKSKGRANSETLEKTAAILSLAGDWLMTTAVFQRQDEAQTDCAPPRMHHFHADGGPKEKPGVTVPIVWFHL
jgi:hypothetical protein